MIQPFETGICLLNRVSVESHIALDTQSLLVYVSENIMADEQGVQAQQGDFVLQNTSVSCLIKLHFVEV